MCSGGWIALAPAPSAFSNALATSSVSKAISHVGLSGDGRPGFFPSCVIKFTEENASVVVPVSISPYSPDSCSIFFSIPKALS